MPKTPSTVRLGSVSTCCDAEYRRRGKVLIDGRQELDVVLVEEAPGAPQLLVDHAERRAAVAADEAGRVQAAGLVERALHQRNANQRLGAGQQHAAGFAPIAIDQFVIVERVVWLASRWLSGMGASRVKPKDHSVADLAREAIPIIPDSDIFR